MQPKHQRLGWPYVKPELKSPSLFRSHFAKPAESIATIRRQTDVSIATEGSVKKPRTHSEESKLSAKKPSKAAPKAANKKAADKKPAAKAKVSSTKKVPASKAVTKPSAKPPLKKTIAKATAKPASKAKAPATPKAAAKVVVKTPPKATAKATPKATAKVTAKSTPKATPKVATKVAAKVGAKSPAKAPIKPASQLTPQSKPKVAAKSSAKGVEPKPVSKPLLKAVKTSEKKSPLAPAPVSPAKKETPSVPTSSPKLSKTAAKYQNESHQAPLVVRPVLPAPAAPLTSRFNIKPVAVKIDPKLANNWKTKSPQELSDAEVLAMPADTYMNDAQLAFFKHKLVTLKDDLLTNADETTEHLREDTVIVPDPADRATIEEEHALELRTRDRERKLLKKIEQSIARIDAGDYGYCDETGEEIGIGRLLARPTANLSLEAQQRRELKQKMFGD